MKYIKSEKLPDLPEEVKELIRLGVYSFWKIDRPITDAEYIAVQHQYPCCHGTEHRTHTLWYLTETGMPLFSISTTSLQLLETGHSPLMLIPKYEDGDGEW